MNCILLDLITRGWKGGRDRSTGSGDNFGIPDSVLPFLVTSFDSSEWNNCKSVWEDFAGTGSIAFE